MDQLGVQMLFSHVSEPNPLTWLSHAHSSGYTPAVQTICV